jgi:hypothetical protein
MPGRVEVSPIVIEFGNAKIAPKERERVSLGNPSLGEFGEKSIEDTLGRFGRVAFSGFLLIGKQLKIHPGTLALCQGCDPQPGSDAIGKYLARARAGFKALARSG